MDNKLKGSDGQKNFNAVSRKLNKKLIFTKVSLYAATDVD